MPDFVRYLQRPAGKGRQQSSVQEMVSRYDFLQVTTNQNTFSHRFLYHLDLTLER
jgi:hypothetical protein